MKKNFDAVIGDLVYQKSTGRFGIIMPASVSFNDLLPSLEDDYIVIGWFDSDAGAAGVKYGGLRTPNEQWVKDILVRNQEW